MNVLDLIDFLDKVVKEHGNLEVQAYPGDEFCVLPRPEFNNYVNAWVDTRKPEKVLMIADNYE